MELRGTLADSRQASERSASSRHGMAGMRSESLRSLAVAILTVQFVLTGTLAALDEAGLAVLEVLKDAESAMLEQSSWRMSQRATAEQMFQEPIPVSAVSDLEVDQIVSARAEAPGEFDTYIRIVDVLSSEGGGQATFTIEVSNVGEDPDAVDDHWVRVSSVAPAELADGTGIPEGEWARVGSVGPDFRDTVLSAVELNNITSLFSGSGFDPNIIEAAEERERETIDGVETRVFFTRLVATQSSLAALMTPLPGLNADGLLEATSEDVNWIDADSLVLVKQESTFDAENEGFTQSLSGTTLFFDYNMPLQVPDSTTTLDEATAAIAG